MFYSVFSRPAVSFIIVLLFVDSSILFRFQINNSFQLIDTLCANPTHSDKGKYFIEY